jgi:serine/threonine protein kinase/Flp pilus assembly protein TadD
MIGQTISHYKILEQIGEGGMGVVYKAQDLKLDRRVAIKFLPQHLSTAAESKARFLQEARATAALNHPNILSVYEIDEQGGGMFMVMEYIEGVTLKKYISNLKSGAGIPVVQAIDWATQIADGLKAAHEKDVVHRDIKPENVMLTSDGKLKIMDFGIAKLKSSSGLTKTGSSIGTLSYMSPEQAQGIAADPRSDIWSLGVVLYEMLTADLPFKAEHEAGLMYLIVNEAPPPTSAMDKKIPRQVDPVVMKMLAKERERRYESMAKVLEALGELKSQITQSSASSKTKSILVLPFGNMSPDKESDYFCDGLTEELIVSLSKLKDIRIIPRSISMQYKGTGKDIKMIGRELGCRHILSGNVRKFQDNLRISVELVDVESDEQLWAETYKGKIEDVFDIQEKVSKQIAEALMLKLSPNEKIVLTKRSTENAEAFDYNLRGRNALYRMSKNDMNSAILLFQRAIELDARYSSAYAGLGETYGWLFFQCDRKEAYLDMAVDACLKALMYDATLSEAYAALGLAYLGKKENAEALNAGKKAIELDPNNATAYWILGRIYHSTDRDRDSVEMFEKTIGLDPDFYSAYGDLQNVYERLGDTGRSNDMIQQSVPMFYRYLAKHPEDARAHMFFATSLVRANRIDEGKQEAAKALELNPSDPLMLYNATCFYAVLGEKQLAIKALKGALAAGYENYEWAKRDSDLESIRNEPAYIELMIGK